MMHALVYSGLIFSLAGAPFADEQPRDLPPAAWSPQTRLVTGLKGPQRAAVGYPAKQRLSLRQVVAGPLPAGVYRLAVTVRPSHACDEIAWHGALVVKAGGQEVGRFPAIDFARVHHPESREIDIVHAKSGPLDLELTAEIDDKVFERAAVRGKLKGQETPAEKEPIQPGEDDLVEELTVGLQPATHFYFLLDAARLEPVTTHVFEGLTLDKIRYRPGEKIRGTAVLRSLDGAPLAGKLTRIVVHDRSTQVSATTSRLAGDADFLEIPLDIPPLAEELGYTVRLEFAPDSGAGEAVASEHFTVADNFQRVSIWGGLASGHGGTFVAPEVMRKNVTEVRRNYVNAVESFAWAEEDMVEMSPAEDVWYSGQTSYRLSKPGLQQLIKAAHEQGVAMTTYGKFVMSGYLGWNTAWNYPHDHQGQFVFPVGMWEGANVQVLDRFRFKEFIPYEHGIDTGGLLNPFWQAFLPINPDPTPRMTRVAAEETIRSIEMFDWDGIRWDGHMRGGGPTGGAAGEYSYVGARKTQTLVRYFKDVIAAKHPRLRHGYNYLFVQEEPGYDWAYEDFELDELCRNGGLLMNESIGNTTMGRKFDWLAKNIQVEGDLARERGGFLLGISYADNPRDQLVESALYFAGGCRPMGGTAKNRIINRYGTRFAKYTFDERLRRLARPEKVLQPVGKTSLWWEPFVYETPREGTTSELVVNLLNIPREAVTRGGNVNAPIDWTMPEGTEPTRFRLTPPQGCVAKSAHLIDPFTLAVTAAPLKNNEVSIPAVDAWRVLIVELQNTADAPALASLYGPPTTFEIPRPGLQTKRFDPVVLDVNRPVDELAPQLKVFDTGAKSPFADEADIAKLTADKRNAALRARKALPENQAEPFLNGWWKGAALPADLKLQDSPPEFGPLAPRRDGTLDLFIARGAMSHRLNLVGALGRLPTFRWQEATLGGFSYNYGLRGNITPADLPGYDALIYADVPHGAIGPEMCYALESYVQQGGGVLFTGGQYSFGKGGYAWTILDRTLLPVQIVQNLDVRIAPTPLPLEAGPDFAALKTKADFKAKPGFCVYNQVALRPGAKVQVFLKSGNRPILVGWEHGEGRVACLLATPMGQSTDESPLFSEWADWPAVLAGVVQWLAPHAGEAPPATADEKQLAAVLKKLGKAQGDGALDDLLDGDGPAATSTPNDDLESKGTKPAAKGLAPDALRQRTAEIEILLAHPSAETEAALAQQLVTVPNLPPDVSRRILLHLAAPATGSQSRAGLSPAKLTELALPAWQSGDVRLRSAAVGLLALAGSSQYADLVRNGVPEGDVDQPALSRAVVLALPLYAAHDLVPTAQSRLAKWDQLAADRLKAYAGGDQFTLASPRRPLLDSDALLARVGWLAYLARREPAKHAAGLAAAWIELAQLEEYCEITEAGLWSETQNATAAKRGAVRAEVGLVHQYRTALVEARELTRPVLTAVHGTHPQETAEGLARAHFQREAEAAVRFLGSLPAEQSQAALQQLAAGSQPLAAEFARARLRGSNQ